MRERSWRLLAAGFVVSVGLGWVSAVPAGAALRISYSGQSVAAKTTVSATTTVLGDTGSLPSSGGALEASSLSGTVSQTLTSTTLHATTIGQGDRVRSESSVGALAVTAGLNNVSADLAMSRATAVSQGGTATISGRSHIDGLVLNGVPVVVTGGVNQTVPILDGQLVINEQVTSGSGDTGSITVNALHITLSSGTDIVLGSSRAGVVAGSQNCSSTDDFATAGGWTQPSGELKRTFGVIGGKRQGSVFQGHLVFVNHELNERVEGRITLSAPGATPNSRHMEGQGQANGELADFQVDVIDNGEPGTQDVFTIRYVSATAGVKNDGGTLGGGNVQVHSVCR